MSSRLSRHTKSHSVYVTHSRDRLAEVQPSVKAGTFRNYNDIVEHRLVPHLGDIRLTDVRRADISRCYTELRKNGRRDGNGGLSETSIEHTHRALTRGRGGPPHGLGSSPATPPTMSSSPSRGTSRCTSGRPGK